MTTTEQVEISQLKTTRPWPEDSLKALIKDLRTNGMQEPVLVRASGLIVIDGMRRIAAAKELGWSKVPAVVTDDLLEICEILREHHPEGIDNARRLDLMSLIHPLQGTRSQQYWRTKAYMEKYGHLKQNLTRGVSHLLMAPALKLNNSARYGSLLTVWRAANSGNKTAQDIIERYRKGELEEYGVVTQYNITKRFFRGDVVGLTDQRALINNTMNNLASVVYSLKKLGDPSKLTVEELQAFADNLYNSRSTITITIHELRKEIEGRK